MTTVRKSFERSGLTDTSDADGYGAELAQRPATAWMFLLFFATFLAVCAGIVLDDPGSSQGDLAPLIGALVLGVPFVLFIVGNLYRTRLILRATATELHIDGWLGRLPRPRSLVLPLAGTQLELRSGFAMNGTKTFKLDFRSGETHLVAPGLACTRAELRMVMRDIERLQTRALDRHGEGESEVPAALGELVAERSVATEEER